MEVNASVPFDEETSYCVPKLLHFIWVGGTLIPEKYQKNIKTFVNNNNDYMINLWTDTTSQELKQNLSELTIRNVTSELNDFVQSEIYTNESNKGARSDMLRYVVVHRYGGVYFDTDSISVQPFHEVLTHSTVSPSYAYRNIQNSFFAFPKGSKFLEYVLRALPVNIAANPDAGVPWRTGPAFFSGCAIRYNDSKINMIDQIHLTLALTNSSITYQTYDATWM